MNDKQKSKLKKIIPAIVCCLVLLFAIMTSIRTFDEQEARDALGQTHDISTGWTVTYADGTTEEDVILPFSADSDKGTPVMLANTLDAEYDGLSFYAQTENSAVKIYVDGDEILSEGYDLPKSGQPWKDGKTVVDEKNQSDPEPTSDVNTTPNDNTDEPTDGGSPISDTDTEETPIDNPQPGDDSSITNPDDNTGSGGENGSGKAPGQDNSDKDNSDPQTTDAPTNTPTQSAPAQTEANSNTPETNPESNNNSSSQSRPFENGSGSSNFNRWTNDPFNNSFNNNFNNFNMNQPSDHGSSSGSGNEPSGNNRPSGNDSQGKNAPGNQGNQGNSNQKAGGNAPGGQNNPGQGDNAAAPENQNNPGQGNNAAAPGNQNNPGQGNNAAAPGSQSNPGQDTSKNPQGSQNNPTQNSQQPSGQDTANTANKTQDASDTASSKSDKSGTSATSKSDTSSGSSVSGKNSNDTGSSKGASAYASEKARKEAVIEAVKEVSENVTLNPTVTDDDGNLQYLQRRAANDILVDLNVKQDGTSTIVLVLDRAKDGKPLSIDAPVIAQRDAAVISRLRGALTPLAGCLILLLVAGAFMVLDIVRIVSHERTRGLILLSLLAIDMLLYSLFGTGILSMFFGNELFFSVIEGACYSLVPFLIAGFMHKGFYRYCPKRANIAMAVSSVSSITVILLDYSGIMRFSDVPGFVFAVQSFVFIITYSMLWNMHCRPLAYRKIWMDAVGYLLIWIALSMKLVSHSSGSNVVEICKMAGTVTGFMFLLAQQADIVLFDYKSKAESVAKTLSLQKEQVEAKAKQLAKANKDAQAARAEAEAANAAKGNFLANMSHEIRTPINAVLGMDEMILRTTSEKETKGYAADIFTAGHTLLSLINDILDFSKIESGKMEIVPVDYDISSMINDLVNMAEARIKDKDLKVIVDVDPALPSWYHGDDVRLRQVITNILTNAVKYTPEGTVTFSVSGAVNDGVCDLTFSIKDTGIGIKEEDIPKLYEEYQRIEEGRNRNIEGTGLGMNITIQLLSLMNSKMEVESVYGKGSRFWFTVKQPVVDASPVGDIKERFASRADTYEYKGSFTAPDARILVVDDNAMNRKVFAGLLIPTKVQVFMAEDGQQSVDMCAKNKYDVIFMDHMMPGMDGIEAMKLIKKSGQNTGTPIYILTANAVAGAKEAYLAEGFDGFLSKPVASAKLEDAIRNNIDKSLIKPADDNNITPASADTGMELSELPAVDGLDWYVADLHLPGEEMLKAGITEFYDVIDIQADKLKKAYDNGDIDAYRIQAHAMKSNAATVGITPLAGMAKILEFAARDGDTGRIEAMHEIFLDEWLSYRDKMRGVFGLGEETAQMLPDANLNEMAAMLEMLSGAMNDFDADQADEIMEEILKYRYPDNIQPMIAELKSAVANLDPDEVGVISRRMTDLIAA